MKSKKQYIEQIKSDMQSLRVYKPEYDHTISVLAEMYIDRDLAMREFKVTGSQYTIEKPQRDGMVIVKNPLYAIIQELNTAIVQTNRELGLTPKGLKALRKKEEEQPKESLLAKVLLDASTS